MQPLFRKRDPRNKPSKFSPAFITSAPMNEKGVTSHNGMQVLGTDLLLGLAGQSVTLGLDTLSAALTESLVLGTLSVHLLLEDTLTLALSLGLLDL